MTRNRVDLPARMRLTCCILLALAGVAAVPSAGQEAASTQTTCAERPGWSPRDRVVIFHADDLGMHRDVNVGTIAAMEKGLVNSTSTMMPCPWVPDYAAYLRDRPEVDNGLHLSLTSEWNVYRWGPLAPAAQVPGLLDRDGYLHREVRDVVLTASADEVEREIRAQIAMAKRMGLPVTHLDTAHPGDTFAHVVRNPEVRSNDLRVMTDPDVIRVAREEGLILTTWRELHERRKALGRTQPARPHGESRYFTTSDGVRLHYLESGTGDLLVLVPGWTMPAWIWEKQIDHFAATHRVIALDPRSQGQSDKPTDGHTPERRARDIHELLAHVNGGRAVLVGWSLAVPEILKYADLFGTGAVRGLVLVDGQLPEAGEEAAAQTGSIFRMLAQMQADRRAFAQAFARSMFRTPQSEDYLRRVTEASLETPTNSAVVLVANMVSYGDWRPAAARMDVPVLFIAQPQLKPSADRLQAALRSARVELLDGAGHALFVDQSERFNTLVRDFIAALKPL